MLASKRRSWRRLRKRMQTNTKKERIVLNRNSRKEIIHEAPSEKQMNPTMNGAKPLMQFSMSKTFP